MNIQVDQKKMELREKRLNALDSWVDIEMKEYTRITEELDTVKGGMEKSKYLLQVKKINQKMQVLLAMKEETLEGLADRPIEGLPTEIRMKYGDLEKEYSDKMKNLIYEDGMMMARRLESLQVRNPPTDDVMSVSSWSVAVDALEKEG